LRVGIIQPNYIPWRGYFDFIDDVDVFIYLDDVQYTKHDWRNRNKIKTSNGLLWITIPVLFSLNQHILIKDAKIDYNSNWIKKHIESIRFSYCKTPFFKDYSEEFFNILCEKHDTISELNVKINNWIMQKLDIKTKIGLSSEVKPEGTKTDKIIDCLKRIGATSYLSGPKAKDYLEIEKFKEAGICLEYKVYLYMEYPQLYGKFEPNVTVLDMLFNCGRDSRKYLKSMKGNEKAF
jgi:hypothetical protein